MLDRLNHDQEKIVEHNAQQSKHSTNNLSENQYLGKDELSAGEMKEGEIILALLLPPNQESARAIEPGMGAFHHPTAGPIARDELFLAFLFHPTANMRLIVACEQFLVDQGGVVGGIQAQMLGLLCCRLGPADD